MMAEDPNQWVKDMVAAAEKGRGHYVMGDTKSFISPIDRSEISSRSQLREHEKKHGVRQCGELKTAADFAPAEFKPVTLDD